MRPSNKWIMLQKHIHVMTKHSAKPTRRFIVWVKNGQSFCLSASALFQVHKLPKFMSQHQKGEFFSKVNPCLRVPEEYCGLPRFSVELVVIAFLSVSKIPTNLRSLIFQVSLGNVFKVQTSHESQWNKRIRFACWDDWIQNTSTR